ncbi:MAG: secretion protein HlyD family protein [Herbinix sp.]|jgi:HlyD family secretion protein|nr:secretion protein HlyD family protein [Herbinix sp.]
MKRFFSKIKWKKVIKWVVIIAIILLVGNFVFQRFSAKRMIPTSDANVTTTAKVETRDIQNVLSSSGTIEPLNTYEVKTLVEGEVIAADFEEGDIVEEGQVLYQIDTDTLDNKMDTAETAVERAEKNYEKATKSYNDAIENHQKAQADYEEASKDYGNANIEATETGIVKTLYVEEGDTIQKGAQIAEIYDNSSMLLVIPFPASEVDNSLLGKKAVVTIEASDETLQGKVTKVSNIDEALSGNRLVNQVTIEVVNPGGLSAQTTATASIGSIYSSAEGTFAVKTQTVIMAENAGKIGTLKIEEGSRIKEGEVIYTLTKESIEDQLESFLSKVENAEDSIDNAKDSVENAQDAIDDAKSSLEDVVDTRTDYSITAPISGKIVSKNALVGDTISSNSNTALCVIYDLSAVTFEMNVDELDVMSVKVGQEVDITADAFENVKMSGVVTNISLVSSANQGVTQYPVTVKIEEVGNLLPGMNVTGEIIIQKVEGVLAIPSDALMRGDVVYVVDASVTEAVGEVPVGFKEVAVETGITDGDYIEIKSGLTGQEEVYVKRISEAIQMMMPGMGFNQGGRDGFTQRSSETTYSTRTMPAGGANSGGRN